MHLRLDYDSIWPVMPCTMLLMGLVSRPIFKVLDAPPAAHPQSRRIRSMDGLRGYLSLAVVFHHAAILRLYLQTGTFQPDTWAPPPSRFFALLGPAAVSMFFMITGYLFWSRLLRKQGKLNWYELYVGRIFRIGPLYFAAVAVALLLDYRTGMNYAARMAGVVTSTAKQAASLFLLGLSVYPDSNKLLVGVTWSIQYEWMFYLALPLLAYLLLTRFQTLLLVATLAACLSIRLLHHGMVPGTRTSPTMAALFLVGMLCGSLEDRDFTALLPDWVKSLLIAGLLISVGAFQDAYSPGPLLLLGCAFYLICSGCTMFGLLTSHAAIRLGDVSYGIYLLQGFAFALCVRPAMVRALFLRSPSWYWSLTLLTLIVLVSLATVTYSIIERPAIRLGRRVANRIDRLLGFEPFIA